MANQESVEADYPAQYIAEALAGFVNDPADSNYQRGYLAAMLAVYIEAMREPDTALIQTLKGQLRN